MEPNGYQLLQIVISSGERVGGRMGRSQEVRIIILADGRPVALGVLVDSRSLAKCCRGFRQFTLARRMA